MRKVPMDMDTAFLSKLVSPIYPGHSCNFNQISFVIKLFKIEREEFIKLMFSVFRKLNDIIVVCESFYYHLHFRTIKIGDLMIKPSLFLLLFHSHIKFGYVY